MQIRRSTKGKGLTARTFGLVGGSTAKRVRANERELTKRDLGKTAKGFDGWQNRGKPPSRKGGWSS